jgi:hypothetical protein
MTPHENQQGTDSTEYESQIARHVAEWDTERLLQVRPTTVPLAREWLGECNRQDAPLEVKEHFADRIRELQG